MYNTRSGIGLFIAVVLLCALSLGGWASGIVVQCKITDQFTDAGIDTTTNPGAVQLAPVEYFVDDNGNRKGKASPNATFWGKKVFTLDTPGATGGQLFAYYNPGKATFNGTPITFTGTEYGGWAVADIPAGVLREGANELVMQSSALQADLNLSPAKHSFYSEDQGKTWKPAAGEFLAHLRLLRYPAKGTITSDVMDLANPLNMDIICPQITVKSIHLRPMGQLPAGTAINVQARTGSTPVPDMTWTNWSDRPQPGRYVQWRATLSTTNHQVTPVLDNVVLEGEVDKGATPQKYTVKDFKNQHIVRSSFPFTYQTPSDKLTSLRTDFHLDDIVAPGKTELEKYILLRNWVRKQWPHNEGNCTRPWDAIDILTAPDGDHGMCVHYGVTFTQCALSLGYNARQIILNNHYVSEIWVNDLRKWVLLDVEAVQMEGWDRHGTAIYLDNNTGVPMNGLELHRAYVNGETKKNVTQVLSMTDEAGNFTPYERTYDKDQYVNFRHFCFPPRNNYLDQLVPWEEQHGVDNYHSNIYYWWSDSPVATRGEYSQFATRPGDLYWTLNQAALTLTATADPAKLEVTVNTETPNFKEFQYRVGGEPWQSLTGAGPGQTSRLGHFTWTLKTGTSTLEIKPRNTFGLDGITSSVTVVK